MGRDELALKRCGHSYFFAWPYWICICRSFPFRHKSYGRRVFKWITQRVLLTFALVKLLAVAPLFNAPKKHVLNYFALEMAAIIVVGRSHHRKCVVEGRGFFPHILFWMPEEHIIRTYCLPSHVIFNLLQKIKDDLEPSTRSHVKTGLSKLIANFHFLASGSFQCTVASLFLNYLFATANLCCAWNIALVDI